MNSRAHVMQASVGAWLYTDVAGIAQAPGSAGYASPLLWPRVTAHEALPYASASFNSIRGELAVAWRNASAAFQLNATVPCNTAAEVRVPFPAAAAGGAVVGAEGGVVFFKNGAFVPGAVAGVTGAALFADAASGAAALSVQVGAGAYAFTTSGW